MTFTPEIAEVGSAPLVHSMADLRAAPLLHLRHYHWKAFNSSSRDVETGAGELCLH